MGKTDEIRRTVVTNLPNGEGMIEPGMRISLLTPHRKFQWPS
jgi:hypothetical protein